MAPKKPTNVVQPTKQLSLHQPSNTKQNFKVTKPQKEYRGKPVFKGKEMCLAGSFTSAGQPATHEKVGKWITQHGGDYVTEVNRDTTHLICSIEDFKSKTPNVMNALNFNKQKGIKIQIVTFDWLEECLSRKTLRCAPTTDFTLQDTLKKLKERAQAEVKHRKNFENGVPSSEPFTGHSMYLHYADICFLAVVEGTFERDKVTDWGKGLHRVYYDGTAFEHKVELKRVDGNGGRTRVEKYTLYLLQSIANPPHFMSAAQLNETIITPSPFTPYRVEPPAKPTKTHRPISYFRDYCQPKEFHNAFADFKHFFHEKTGLKWDDRLEDGVKGKFQYVVPAEGKPVGWLPPGRERKGRYPKLSIDEELEEGLGAEGHGERGEKMNGIQASEGLEAARGWEGSNAGAEAITRFHTPEISVQGSEVEVTDAPTPFKTSISEASSATLRGDTAEGADETQAVAVNLIADVSPDREDGSMDVIIISDDDDSDVSEAGDEEVGGNLDRPKAMIFEDVDHFEKSEDCDEF